jgi:hypothetical protein
LHSRDRRFATIPPERRERRTPLEAPDKVLEYDIYGQYQYMRDDGRLAREEWGRRWCQVEECAEVEGWVEKLKAYELELKELREEAEQTHGVV